ncbi:MAG: hypothetical protein QNJ38_24905 [Prochloraceae cyanobacterium]|nr:hypothetical protein [Prochloraceae cyanobacterium]
MQDLICCLLKAALLGKESERASAKESLCLLIDQIPEIKTYIDEGLQIYLDEALKKTELYVSKNLHKFPERYKLNIEELDCQKISDTLQIKKCFIRWTRMILKADCIDERRKKFRQVSLDSSLTKGDRVTQLYQVIPAPTLSGIEEILQQERKNIAIKVRNYIDIDPEGILRNCHPRSQKRCNCQILMQMNLLQEPPVSPKEIALKLGTPLPTVYERLGKCKKLLREIVARIEQQNWE